MFIASYYSLIWELFLLSCTLSRLKNRIKLIPLSDMSCSGEHVSHSTSDSLIQITPEVVSKLRKAKYGVYNHSAVELCHWTKKSFANEGSCYKHKFYGISKIG